MKQDILLIWDTENANHTELAASGLEDGFSIQKCYTEPCTSILWAAPGNG